MGSGNSNCEKQDCLDDCCNEHGTCPDEYDYFRDGSEYSSCKYYYRDNTWVLGFIIPIIFFVVFLVVCIILVRKRRQQQQQWTGNQQVVIATQDNFGNQPPYGQQPYEQPGNTGQPMYNQELYNNPQQYNPQYGAPINDPYSAPNQGAPYNNYLNQNGQNGGNGMYGASPIVRNY